jgi:hypothetical protein
MDKKWFLEVFRDQKERGVFGLMRISSYAEAALAKFLNENNFAPGEFEVLPRRGFHEGQSDFEISIMYYADHKIK